MKTANKYPVILKAVWIASENKNQRTKGQWHKWIQEVFNFFKAR